MEPNHNKSINEITNTRNQIIINLLTKKQYMEQNHNKSINVTRNTQNKIIINLLT